jgi:alpha-D-ribose 1-methylphosphonate 5-triphosphate synthase subunit PhnG
MDLAKQIEPSVEMTERRRAAGLLAKASMNELDEAWGKLVQKPDVTPVRGRIGGGGTPFNLGEATVTRATVLTASGTAGHAHALGTDKKKVRLAAIFDALWQESATREFVETAVLAPVEARVVAEDKQKAEETAATRVDFFTMVRGED